MAKTIPGGAYLSADGKTWHDANGKTIPAPGGNVSGKSKKKDQDPAPVDDAPVADESVG